VTCSTDEEVRNLQVLVEKRERIDPLLHLGTEEKIILEQS
jgi:hypothetical protein